MLNVKPQSTRERPTLPPLRCCAYVHTPQDSRVRQQGGTEHTVKKLRVTWLKKVIVSQRNVNQITYVSILQFEEN